MSLSLPANLTRANTTNAVDIRSRKGISIEVLGYPCDTRPSKDRILTGAHKSFSGSEFPTGVRWGTPSKPSEAGVLASAQTGLGSAAGDLTSQHRRQTALGTRSNGLQAVIRPKCGAVKFIRRTLGK